MRRLIFQLTYTVQAEAKTLMCVLRVEFHNQLYDTAIPNKAPVLYWITLSISYHGHEFATGKQLPVIGVSWTPTVSDRTDYLIKSRPVRAILGLLCDVVGFTKCLLVALIACSILFGEDECCTKQLRAILCFLGLPAMEEQKMTLSCIKYVIVIFHNYLLYRILFCCMLI